MGTKGAIFLQKHVNIRFGTKKGKWDIQKMILCTKVHFTCVHERFGAKKVFRFAKFLQTHYLID